MPHLWCGERSSAAQAAPGDESALPPGVGARPASGSPLEDSALGRRSSGGGAGGAPGAAAQAASVAANAVHSRPASPLAAPGHNHMLG